MAVNAFDRAQRRHPALGLPIAVVYKFVEDQGMYLAAIVAFYGMFSIFPLLLLLSSLLGFALNTRPDVQEQIIDAALRLVPLLDETFVRRQLTGSGVSLAIGAVGATMGALGVGTAIQNAMNMVWSVPRHLRPNPVVVRLRSLALLLVLLLFVLLSTALSQLAPFLSRFDPQELEFAWVAPVNSGVGVVASFVLTVLTFGLITRLAARTPLSFRERLPGALLGAVLWQVLQGAGAAYVSVYVSRASIADGVFSSLLGVLLWVFLAGVVLVLSLEFNVVFVDGLYPRSLKAVFVDDPDLTEADKRVYARKAGAVRFKSFQRIDVSFEGRSETETLRMRLRRLRGGPEEAGGRLPQGAADAGAAAGTRSSTSPPGVTGATGTTSTTGTAGTTGTTGTTGATEATGALRDAMRLRTRPKEGGRDGGGHPQGGAERRAHDEATP